jgi:hypothetical protein
LLRPDRLPSDTLKALKEEMVARHGVGQRQRIERGIDQVAALWGRDDGSDETLLAFARENFISDQRLLDGTFARLQHTLEQVDGHLNEIGREMRYASKVDVGPVLPVETLLASMDPHAHIEEDLFSSKVAFVVLLNFPLTSLDDRTRDGKNWSRRQWAEARLALRFSRRIPAAVKQGIRKASAAGDAYIAAYNIWMHHLVDEKGRRPFPKGMRLISHWNLRDELKADYAEPEGVLKQRMIATVLERIVTQSIPQVVIDNPVVDWSPVSNTVDAAPEETIESDAPPLEIGGRPRGNATQVSSEREEDARYAHLLATFHAAREADPYCPGTPTLIARRFEENRELSETRVIQLLEDVLTSPLAPRVARLIETRLGRKLEAFDIWYSGFQPRGPYSEEKLDAIVRERYPTVDAFQADLGRLLTVLGFTPDRAAYLAGNIVVDPSRGAGHAMPALRRGDKPRLRTRVGKDGMDYKGYNIAIHELGHNVEQIFSLYDVDHTLLARVPNNSFTEALAFVFQRRDLELLGLELLDLENGAAESERLSTLNTFWMTYEIAGPAMVDILVWRWMYEHPDANPAALREATVRISREVWNRYYASVLGVRDSVLLGVYSHMVSLMMYLPDYPLGHLIAFQIEEHLEQGKDLGEEFERMATFGSVTPDLWMEHATGSLVSAEPLLRATERALKP